MKNRFPISIEFITIIMLSLGYLIYSSFSWVFSEESTNNITFSNYDIIFLMIYELIVIALIFSVSKTQGRSAKDLGFRFSIDSVTAGFILFAVSYGGYFLLYRTLSGVYIFDALSGGENVGTAITFEVSMVWIALFIIINPLFEELVLVGYTVSVCQKRHSIWFCAIISLVLRLSFHIYQGPIVLASIVPMSLIFTFYFVYKKDIYPLIIAHAIMDFLSFYISYFIIE